MIKIRARMIANVRSASLNRIKKERDVFSFHWLHVDRIGLQRFNIYIYIEGYIPNRKVPLIPGTIWYIHIRCIREYTFLGAKETETQPP